MNKILSVICLSALVFFSIELNAQTKTRVKTSSYGAKINSGKAIAATTLLKQMEGKDSLNVKVTGKIIDVCQRKGCWMNVDLGNGKEMMVRFKDYGFFIPKDAAGKTVVVEGVAYKTETSVDELRHYAGDAGKNKAEIEKITEPKKNTSFEASGVLIYNE